jgi:hypothetical protein
MHILKAEKADNVRVCQSFNELARTNFDDRVNCVLLNRTLEGDFDGLAKSIATHLDIETGGYKTITEKGFDAVCSLDLPEEQRQAFRQIKKDFADVASLFKYPAISLRVIRGYKGSKMLNQYHADGSSRLLAAYNNPTTQFIAGHDSIVTKLNEYRAGPNAKAYAFEPGAVWHHRGNMDYVGGAEEKNFIHRGPNAGVNGVRLLLVAGPY